MRNLLFIIVIGIFLSACEKEDIQIDTVSEDVSLDMWMYQRKATL